MSHHITSAPIPLNGIPVTSTLLPSPSSSAQGPRGSVTCPQCWHPVPPHVLPYGSKAFTPCALRLLGSPPEQGWGNLSLPKSWVPNPVPRWCPCSGGQSLTGVDLASSTAIFHALQTKERHSFLVGAGGVGIVPSLPTGIWMWPWGQHCLIPY